MHLLARVPRVDAHSRLPLGRRELAETGEIDLVTPLERVRDRVEHGVDRFAGFAATETAAVRDRVDELLLGHLGPPPLDMMEHGAEPTTPRHSAQPCGFATADRGGTTSATRNRGCRRTPRRARQSTPPSSRSMTHIAVLHSSAACRTARTASAAAPPDVTTSSTSTTRSPGSNAPSSRFAVPYSFASPRTIRNGSPDASEAAAASATAPSSGPASRCASGSTSAILAARRAPSARSSFGTVSKRYLSR